MSLSYNLKIKQQEEVVRTKWYRKKINYTRYIKSIFPLLISLSSLSSQLHVSREEVASQQRENLIFSLRVSENLSSSRKTSSRPEI